MLHTPVISSSDNQTKKSGHKLQVLISASGPDPPPSPTPFSTSAQG